MKKLLKILIWLAGILIVLVILAAGGLYLFFPKEKVKEIALEKISANLNREVTIDGVAISFVGGIGLKLENLKIANATGFEEPFLLASENLDVKVQFWPLLKKQIMIDRMILNAPEFILHKQKDGTVNYEFKDTEKKIPERIKDKLPEDTRAAGALVSFDNLTINNGRLAYIDDSSEVSITINGLNLKSRLTNGKELIYKSYGELSTTQFVIEYGDLKVPELSIDLEFSAVADLNKNQAVVKIPQAQVNNLQFNANVGIPNLKTMAFINTEINSDKLGLKDLLSLLPQQYKEMTTEYTIDGFISPDFKIKYNANAKESISYEGTSGIESLTAARVNLPGSFTLDKGSLEIIGEKLLVDIEQGSFDGNPLSGKIGIKNFDNPNIIANLKGTVDLAGIVKFFTVDPKPELSGTAEYDLEISGPIDNKEHLDISGRIAVNDAKYNADVFPEPINNFSAVLNITPEQIKIEKFVTEFESSDFSLTGTMSDPFPGLMPGYEGSDKEPFLDFTVESNRFDVDKMFPEAAPGAGANLTQIPIDSLPPLPIPAVNGRGVGKIDTLIYTGVEFTSIKSDLNISDRTIFADNVTGDVYSGKVSGNASVNLADLNNPVYAGNFDAQQIEANDFLSRFTNFGGHLFGKLDMKGSFDAAGLDPNEMLNSLTMNGDAIFKEAKLVNFDFLNKLADQFNMKRIDEEKIRDFASAFHVADGRVHFDDTEFMSKLGDWDIAGSVGFDGSLDYTGTILLSDDLTAQAMSRFGTVAGLLKDGRTGRIRVPLNIGGTYSSPKIGLDIGRSNNIQENVTDALKNLFGN